VAAGVTVTVAAAPAGRVLTVAKSGGQYSTIQAAADASRPGDTVLISAGTYVESLRPRSGAEGEVITYRAEEGARVVLDGEKRLSSGDGLLNLDGRSWLRFDGITITRSPTHGVYGYEASNVEFVGCEVSSSSDGGLVLLGASDVLVDGCDVHHNNDEGTSASHEAVTMGEGTTRFVVRNSRVHENGEEGIDAKYNDEAAGKIHDNLVYDNRGPNIYVDSSSDVEVYNNVSYGATAETKAGIAIAVEDWSDSRQATDIAIYNNVSYGNAGGGISFWKESSGTIARITIVNNTLVDNPEAALVGADEVTGPGSIVRNNLFNGNDPGIGGSFVADTNLTADPLFVDRESGDYRLLPDSPAIDAANPTGAPTFDCDNTSRPTGAGPDIGAYEAA